jgi:hypothetical protein
MARSLLKCRVWALVSYSYRLEKHQLRLVFGEKPPFNYRGAWPSTTASEASHSVLRDGGIPEPGGPLCPVYLSL